MLNKLLKTLVDICVVLLLAVGLTSCASGGGSSALVQETSITPPTTTTYTPPTWDGISYTETNPIESTGEYADIIYKRISAEEFMNANPTWSFDGNSDYDRTNIGLLHVSNSGYVGAVNTQFESHNEQYVLSLIHI